MKKFRIPGKDVGTGTTTGVSKPEQTFTKAQVSDLMRKRVERSHQSFFKRYGVKDLVELDQLVGKSRSYDPMKQRFDDLTNQHVDLTKRYAYKVGNINPDKYSDIETYFKGKNLDVNEENLTKELSAHPDWVNKVSAVEVIGAEANTPPTQSDAEIASNLLGVDLT